MNGMKEQYLAQVKIKGDIWYNQGEWMNVSIMNGGPRYLKTKDEAIAAIEKVSKRFDGKEKIEVISHGGIGVSSKIDEGTKVVESRIRRRYVSEWEDI